MFYKPRMEIVTHCWSGSDVPIYDKLLQLQLSSIFLSDTTIPTQVTVFFNQGDSRTVRVVNYFEEKFDAIPNLYLQPQPLLQSHLFRRAIGRNQAALETVADVVWFTDCDYLFGGSSIDSAYTKGLKNPDTLIWPRCINIHKNHRLGDRLVADMRRDRNLIYVKPIDENDFAPRKERIAIGGIQIIDGDWCRENGYLKDTRWQTPVDPKLGFQSCRGDVPFRKTISKKLAVDIPHVYRVRHSFCGRDHGTVDHGAR